MRYAQGGGLTPRRQAAREQLRLEAAERFAGGEKTADIARELRVGERQVEKWRRAWREGGAEALRSKGPMCVELLSPAQWERLVRELERGTLAHGWDEDQGWTLVRIRALIIRLFLVEYTVQGGVEVDAAARLVCAGAGEAGAGAGRRECRAVAE
ncbi:helix-turn-helix domain-containing protein [Streptomyces sp. MNU76]|uniref:helix-turn-helix domain-containing protein n=1 Tax=Streptomyces sp. MNU76 TaxID=2560026 RepID=UPI0027DF6E09|nr:helix-turn-helix domain-containing protein [Streptomyces sp. MNU76]